MQEKGSHGHKGGRGVIPYPPSFIFSSGGYPPPHVPGKVGVTPQGAGRFFPGIIRN